MWLAVRVRSVSMLAMRRLASTTSPLGLASALASALALAVSCGGDKPASSGEEPEKTVAAASVADAAVDSAGMPAADAAGALTASAGDSAATPSAEAGGEAADAGGDPAASAGEPAGADSAGADSAPAGDAAGDADSADEAAASAGAEPADDTAAPKEEVDPEVVTKAEIEALLKTARNKRTSDAKADKALADAEAKGADGPTLAKAANDRGLALMGEAERAIKLFEYARDKDPKFADASFNLAKIEVLSGNVAGTIAHLEEVKKRGGRSLLKTVGYDPLFEVVKDDRTVQALIR